MSNTARIIIETMDLNSVDECERIAVAFAGMPGKGPKAIVKAAWAAYDRKRAAGWR